MDHCDDDDGDDDNVKEEDGGHDDSSDNDEDDENLAEGQTIYKNLHNVMRHVWEFKSGNTTLNTDNG